MLAVIACLLAAMEAGLTAFNRGRAERMVEEEVRGAGRLLRLAQDPAPSLNSLMVLRMLCEVSTITLAALIVFDDVEETGVRILITVGVMALVSFIFWGVGPRTLGRQNPERVMRIFGPLISVLTTVLSPVAALMVMLGNALTPGRGYVDGPFASESELRDMVDMAEANELIEADEKRMIHSVFELGDTLVKEVMVPRTDVVFIPEDRTLRQLLSLALRSGFSRIPVVGQGGVDDVLGICYLKDVAKRVHDLPDAERTQTVREVMRPATFVPDSKPASELLREMQRSHSHVVIVIDEFGGTAGLATMEDIVEEIVGEIVDEYDQEIPAVAEIEPGYFRVSARLPLDKLGELFELDFDDEDVETVGGLMAKSLNVVPIPGSRVVHHGIEMVADRAVGRRRQVGTVLVRRAPADEPDTTDQEETA